MEKRWFLQNCRNFRKMRSRNNVFGNSRLADIEQREKRWLGKLSCLIKKVWGIIKLYQRRWKDRDFQRKYNK